MSNIIEVYPLAGKTARTAPAWQYDYGQILHVNGLELPASYKAEFSNTTRGDAIATVQSTDEITIPAQFLESGNPVYIWLVVVDEQSRTTEYALIVPVAARAKPTDEEPTPEEQSEIDQTLAALNEAVSDVQEIADAIPDTINDALAEAKASGEFDGEDGYTPQKGVDYFDGEPGQDGVSPTITVAPITGGHRITITDANGTHTVDVLDGENGDTGRGIVSVQKTGTAGLVDTYTITYTDNTVSTFTVTNGQNGNDGISPSITVNDITGGHRVTITDADGAHSFDVMDGEDGQGAVQDVQIDGVSVLTDGVANVPKASQYVDGVVMVDRDYGIDLSYGKLSINAATSAEVKAGTASRKTIVAARQHESTFYGLAKAAGDTTQSASSNAVGQYTESAKSAISTMLNGPVTVSGTTPSITALPGIQYVCGEVATLDITLPASGCVDVVFTSGSTPTVLTVTPQTGVTLKWANGFDPTALEADTTYEINICDGLGVAGSWT